MTDIDSKVTRRTVYDGTATCLLTNDPIVISGCEYHIEVIVERYEDTYAEEGETEIYYGMEVKVSHPESDNFIGAFDYGPIKTEDALITKLKHDWGTKTLITTQECIDWIKADLTDQEFRGYSKCKDVQYAPVNHPEHYASGSLECIDWIKAELTEREFRGYLKGNVLKYLWRHENKGNPVQDLSKAGWYLEKLKERFEEDEDEEKYKKWCEEHAILP